ncbi:MAG: hypothetical protein MI919_11180 [Holophagales bacterium]|nr:hypothetical protein [Holophagales bacterium]
MSGRQRIPPLRVEFIDERAGPAGSKSGAEAEVKELLTEELAVTVASVLPEGDVSTQLSEPVGKLDIRDDSSILTSTWLWLAVIVLFGAGVVLGFYTWRQARRSRARVSAYDVAMGRLSALEGRGMPAADQIDGWYVDLSGIIRRYLEDRYGLRAPELTTEEFLLVARRSGQISSAHRTLLSTFLSGCDRVKFAGYEPDASESRSSLEAARLFVVESRLMPEKVPGNAPANASDRGPDNPPGDSPDESLRNSQQNSDETSEVRP